MIEIDNETMEAAWNNQDYRNVMHSASKHFLSRIREDDLKSLQMEVLWYCLKNYDSNKDNKFTSYLYLCMKYKLFDYFKIKRKHQKLCNVSKLEVEEKNSKLFNTVQYDLDQEDKEIISNRFYMQKTFKEMSEDMNLSVPKVKKRLKKALQKLKMEY